MAPRSILASGISLLVVSLPIIVLAIVPMPTVGSAGAAEAPADDDPTAFLYTVATRYEPLAWMHGADRFPSGAAIVLHDSSRKGPLAADFAASADPAVSFDGQHVLFAGKRTQQDPWQIWEISLTGGEARRVTSNSQDCVRPFYLPEDRVIYACKNAGRFVIEAVNLGEKKSLPLTYGPANSLPTDVLRDGRILFEAGYPLGSESTVELYTVYSDGSGVESYRCDHGQTHHHGKQISSGDIVFASSSGLARFTSARAQEVQVSAPTGEYGGDIAETPSGDWLLPWRADAKASFQLMIWSPGAPTLRSFVNEPGANVLQPVVIRERLVPNRHPSGLHDWPNANLLCLNVYTSKYKFSAGSIESVRLYSRDDAGNAKLLGTAPVERDGSFFVQVPTEQGLQIELLDATGKTIKREEGFYWMRRGEQRVCVGCHAGPETAPENAVPMTLLRSTTPADLTGSATHNASGGH